jgi:hydroxymethylpyrimidine/phosphomethylpyrimidine kinase
MHMQRPCVLTIAGSDSSGGAGIQADIKAMSATGSFAASVITALTAQNTLGVQAIHEIPLGFVEAQLNSVFSDLNIAAVKIGMLANKEIMMAVAASLKKYHRGVVVLDPVMVSKNGFPLIENSVLPVLKNELLHTATVITPNVVEAEKLLDCTIITATDQSNAAKSLGEEYKINVLVKGGHMQCSGSDDVLYQYHDKSFAWFHADRVDTKNTHGTGCTLSSAIASYLAQGNTLAESINKAKLYISNAIEAASRVNIGKGCGPVEHFYFVPYTCGKH